MKKTIKYFTKAALVLANREAIKTNRNRTLVPEAIAGLKANVKFPIVFSMIHNDVEMRVQIVVGFLENLTTVWLDIPFKVYDALPSEEVEVH